jgi:hypothetical protein
MVVGAYAADRRPSHDDLSNLKLSSGAACRLLHR